MTPTLAGTTKTSVYDAASTATATVSAMVFGMLALEISPERRSATLNLVYLPLYAAGITGPALGAGVVTLAGLPGPFLLGSAVFLAGAVVVASNRTGVGAR